MGNAGYSQSIMLSLWHSLIVTLCSYLCMVFLPWGAIFCKLIPCGHPRGCSPPSTTPTWVHMIWPILQEHTIPAWSPQTAACQGLSMGCGSFKPHPLLHSGLLHGCTWRSTLCGTHGLQKDSQLFMSFFWAVAGIPSALLHWHAHKEVSDIFSLFSHSYCCKAVFPLNLRSQRRT